MFLNWEIQQKLRDYGQSTVDSTLGQDPHDQLDGKYGDMPAMSIWSGTSTNTITRSNKCELASNPSKSDKIGSVMS